MSTIEKSEVLAALLAKAEEVGHSEAHAAVNELIEELELRPPAEKVVRAVVEFPVETWDRLTTDSVRQTVTSYGGTLVSAEEVEVGADFAL